MNFYAETENHKQKRLAEIGQLAYERYKLSIEIESCQKKVEDIDNLIAEREAVIQSYTQSQKDFNTYLAVKECALTVDDIQHGIEAAMEITEEETNA